ncbi:glycosyltransferase BC10-like [Panicum virgatum]|uniref:Core-2/I-branching beta-16-N-acetylglucosaminyltransferase family protein n=1 Tax=Panicum virgatum TaxID=38727 RepID=A0A8T0RBK1_PANVG|nr:glycosyltransferase BC10-like [Panicum virgatum]KAG2582626.1 hypothetical protein PVAP13_6KG185000 [Panicum virgatum]
MTAKNNLKQQHALPMVVAGMAATPACPVRTKLLLCAALGFALGVAATVSLLTSSASPYTASLHAHGGALAGLFLPASATAAANAVRDDRQQQPPAAPRPPRPEGQGPPAPAVPAPATIRRPRSWTERPPAAGISAITTTTAPPPPTPAGGAFLSSGSIGDDDEELMALAASAPRAVPPGAAPKVAFLFLTRWDLPMAPLWNSFFHGHRGRYNVYVHTDPAFNGSEPPETSAFHRRRIPSKEVKWGHVSMVEAERRLLAHALLDDPSNARFVLLSESHVPLFDFPTVHSYLVNSTQVFLESYDQPGATGRGRYSRRMSPVVAAAQWRKGSQWFDLDRGLAADVVADRVYFPVFRRFCSRGCYADEHYLPTLINIRRPAAAANRSLTWVDWSRGGPHPARFTRMQVTVDFLRWLRSGTTCTYNGRTTDVCFLFARKFLPNSLTRFLRFAPKVMGFG